VFEHIEVLVLNLPTLCTLFAEIDQFGVLFQTLGRLEEVAACIRGF
jgi:hypothetical protein